MTDATMYDSVNWQEIPQDAEYISIYRNGQFAVPWEEVQHRFPHAHLIGIDVNGSDPKAGTLDIERFDASPADVPGWVARRLDEVGKDVLCRLYMNMSTWPAVQHYVSNLSPAQRGQVRYWVADWTGTAHIPAGADACQWESTQHWDRSLINVERYAPQS